MRLGQFYSRAIKIGKEYDPRGKGYFRKLPKEKNPYVDSQILCGDAEREVKNILIGIDIEVGEILLADKIRQSEGLDLVIAHHPEGKALSGLNEVMGVQIQMLKKAGLAEGVAKDLVEERMREIERKTLSANHMRSVDVARLLDIPFICLHTAADNLASYFVQKSIKEKKPKTLEDILRALEEIPEYRLAKKETQGPRILLGNPRSPAGKIFMEMTGGTEGPKDVFGRLYDAGIRTLIGMHLSEEHFRKVKDINLNVIIAGHISSDTLGMNLLLDQVGKNERFHIIECSGFRRITRN